MITFCRLRPVAAPTARLAATLRQEGTTVVEMAWPAPAHLAAVLAGGLLPVAARTSVAAAAAWVLDPAEASVLGAGWRVTILDRGPQEQVRGALAASGAAYLRTGRSRVAAAAALARGTGAAVSVFVNGVEQARAAVEAGATDLLLRDWDSERLGQLRDALGDRELVERTTFPPGVPYEELAAELPPPVLAAYLGLTDAEGAARPRHSWAPGKDLPPPATGGRLSARWADTAWAARPPTRRARPAVEEILRRAREGRPPSREGLEMLLRARGDLEAVAATADELRARAVGDRVTYVVNRNINFTNRCAYRCGFCAFSAGPRGSAAGERPFLLSPEEVAARAAAAEAAGATEVCLQGGIHPGLDGRWYLDLIRAVRAAAPGIHIHALSPLEVWRGARSIGRGIEDYLRSLKAAGLDSLPGTAAEILDPGVRRILCPAKLSAAEWVEVATAAHRAGLPTTATMMFGHVDSPASWAAHLDTLRRLQARTGGFTEFVPLPFVHMEAPIFREGRARPGPTWDEVVAVHAVARLALDGAIPNIQASWVKLGLEGAAALLRAGVNDLGGTLVEESISRAAGGQHGPAMPVERLREAIAGAGRLPGQRTTLYEAVAPVPGG